jgi:uncharacterized protein YabE (DUF348 family)
VSTTQPVTLAIDERVFTVSTHQNQVAAILRELGVNLAPEDVIQPSPDTTLVAGETLRIRLARPVTINFDGRQWSGLTQRLRLDQLLADAGLTLHSRDEVWVDGMLQPQDGTLPQAETSPPASAYRRLLSATTPREFVKEMRPQPLTVDIHRAVPVTLFDEQSRSRFFTARQTVAEVLAEQAIVLADGDRVTPALDVRLTARMRIYIERATPLFVQADGEIVKVRTHRETVGEVLAEQGFALMGQDYSRVPLNQPVVPNETVEIVRVRETVEFEEEYIPFETEWVPDETMELDQRAILQTGATGILRTRIRVRYENDEEMWRRFEDEWLAQSPANQIIAYGTRIVVRALETPEGPIEYWRRISMRATAYSAATSGKDADHPRYGITSTGLKAGFGIVAVDPKVIPLRTQLYIEKYGEAIAGDTGGRILGKHIDLGYPDDQPLPQIFEWRDVYVLTPVPPADKIRFVLPNWPQR